MTAPDGLYIPFCQNISFRQLPAMSEPCWEWTGRADPKNYGLLCVKHSEEFVHRIIYRIFVGDIAGYEVVRHRCDNPPCCNPLHLLKGSRKDNVDDCHERFRHAFGEKTGNRILTDAAVLTMRNEYALGGASVIKLGLKYGVNERTVRAALCGATWKHVKGPIHHPRKRSGFISPRLSEEQVALVRAVYLRWVPGYGSPTLAKYFGVSRRSIMRTLQAVQKDNRVSFEGILPEDAPWIAVSTTCVTCLKFESCAEVPHVGWMCGRCVYEHALSLNSKHGVSVCDVG